MLIKSNLRHSWSSNLRHSTSPVLTCLIWQHCVVLWLTNRTVRAYDSNPVWHMARYKCCLLTYLLTYLSSVMAIKFRITLCLKKTTLKTTLMLHKLCLFSTPQACVHPHSPGECGRLWTEPISYSKCSKWRPLAFPHACSHPHSSGEDTCLWRTEKTISGFMFP